MTIDDAYADPAAPDGSSRLAAGEARMVGKKIGVTSQAVMNMLGVFQPTLAG